MKNLVVIALLLAGSVANSKGLNRNNDLGGLKNEDPFQFNHNTPSRHDANLNLEKAKEFGLEDYLPDAKKKSIQKLNSDGRQ